MFQKILLFCLFCIISTVSTFASLEKAEDVFIDIDSDYTYLPELQTLFEAGIIVPDERGKFNPYKLLTREEFVGTLMETNCTKCLKPDASYSLINNYLNKSIYYDVNKESNYFYCIAEADDKNYIRGYDAGSVCENGVSKIDEKPFCPQNTIILEEALAIIMRTGNILTQQEASSILNSIGEVSIYQDLSEDVKTTNLDGSLYSFYPYFYKAENFIISEYDIFGKENFYSLIEKESNKYYPKKNINREDFLKIAIFALKNSNCIEQKNEDISLEIGLFEGICSESSTQCNSARNFNVDTPIDLKAQAQSQCLLGVDDATGYSWVIYNLSENTETIYNGRYLDDFNFPNGGNYRIILEVQDNCDNISSISKNITISGNGENDFFASIDSNISQEINMVDFISTIVGDNGPYEFSWDFGDGNTSTEENPTHQYTESGIYDVTLIVTDSQGIENTVPTTINLYPEDFTISIGVDLVTVGGNDFVDFTGYVSDQESDFTYLWDFGDGTTSNEQSPIHEYSQPGVYTTTFSVTDNTGETKTATTQITITSDGFGVQISTQSEDVANGLEASFTPIIEGGSGPFTYEWDFGDGDSSTQESPTHVFTEPGEYEVTLNAIDENGDLQTTYTTIVVGGSGIGSDIETQIVAGSKGEFDFEGIVYGGEGPFIYSWDFGDNTTSTDQISNHTYTQDGTYEAAFTITDSSGNTSTSYTSIVVIGADNNNFNISVSADITQGDLPLISTFSVTTIGNTGPYTYLWDFGDGTSGVGNTVTHTFTALGTYTISIIVTDSIGNIKTEFITITVDNSNNSEEDASSTLDTDNDGIVDVSDKCPSIPGDIENDGCPIFEETCSTDSDCPDNATCKQNTQGVSVCSTKVFQNNCNYSGNSTVFGNAVCNSCPCQNVLDFNAQLRNCDVVFPAITSPDGSEIYSKGKYFQIKN